MYLLGGVYSEPTLPLDRTSEQISNRTHDSSPYLQSNVNASDYTAYRCPNYNVDSVYPAFPSS